MSSGRDNDLSRDKTLINRKLVVRGAGGGDKVYMDATSRPFSRLGEDDLLDTADLCVLFRTSARTIYRWTSERELRWACKVGREYLFSKGDVLDWWDEYRPSLGRPASPARRR